MLDLNYNYIISSLTQCNKSLNYIPSEVMSELRYQHQLRFQRLAKHYWSFQQHSLKYILVDAGQIIIGSKYLPSALTHSIAVTTVRFTRAPLSYRRLSLSTSTLTLASIMSIIPVSSMLQTFSGRIVLFWSTSLIFLNQSISLSLMLFRCIKKYYIT